MAGPLYRQIADQLRRLIESGELRGGMQIPTEDQLMGQFLPLATPSAAHCGN